MKNKILYHIFSSLFVRRLVNSFCEVVDGVCGIFSLGFWHPNISMNWLTFSTLKEMELQKIIADDNPPTVEKTTLTRERFIATYNVEVPQDNITKQEQVKKKGLKFRAIDDSGHSVTIEVQGNGLVKEGEWDLIHYYWDLDGENVRDFLANLGWVLKDEISCYAMNNAFACQYSTGDGENKRFTKLYADNCKKHFGWEIIYGDNKNPIGHKNLDGKLVRWS